MFGKVLFVNFLLAAFVLTARAQFFDGVPSINVSPVNNAKSYSGANPYTNQDARDIHGTNYNPNPYYG